MRQLGLFAETATQREPPTPDFSEARTLAMRLPRALRFGTSSWTFPGWAGIVYPDGTSERVLRERGLELYVRHPLLSTVGIDRSYYAPLDGKTLDRYAEQLPAGFPTVQKVSAEVTTYADPRSGELNPKFLQPDWCIERVLRPNLEHFAAHLGALVFEFPPLRGSRRLSPAAFAERLDAFFGKLPGGLPYAVEIRNRELLSVEYAQVLAARGVTHVFNFWEGMPTVGQQRSLPGLEAASDRVVCRLLIPPGQRYSERKQSLEPFDRLVDPQPEMRRDVVDLALASVTGGRAVLVIVNNKAEGSSPLTVEALARLVAQRVQRADGKE